MQPVSARENRAVFCEAMSTVRMDWNEDRVQAVLGPPDDVISEDNAGELKYTLWCYGTNGHLTLPTLGYVAFRGGEVEYCVGGSGVSPSPSLIGETELVAAMRRIDQISDPGPGPEAHGRVSHNPRLLIRLANFLLQKHSVKAMAIIGEYSRVSHRQDELFYWLSRVMFTSTLREGVFPPPTSGAIRPEPPKHSAEWPTYPIVIIDSVPFRFDLGLFGVEGGAPFSLYFRAYSKSWRARPYPITPPPDPFSAYKKLLSSSVWKYLQAKFFEVEALRNLLQGEVLELVATAYRPETENDFDQSHKEFLALKCHWDAKEQTYVRGAAALTGRVSPTKRASSPH